MKESEENHVPGAFMKSGYDTNFNPNAVSFIPSPSISNDQISSKNTKENHVVGASQNSGYDKNLNPNARPFLPLPSLSNIKISSTKSDEDDEGSIHCVIHTKLQPMMAVSKIENKIESEESIRTFINEQLCKYGPMEVSDRRLSFESYLGYLCSKGGAEKLEKQSIETGVKWQNLGAGPRLRAEGVQTDISSFNVDADDPFVLQKKNELLAEKLHIVSDKLAVLQEKSKLEQRELSTQIAMALELKANEKKAQKDLRTTKECFDATFNKNLNLETELKEVKKNLEDEKKFSFNLQQKIRERDDTIFFLKLKCLKSDFYPADFASLTRFL